MKPRHSAKDYREAAGESERKYDEGKENRWYNKNKKGNLLPHIVVIGASLIVAAGIFYKVASDLYSMIPETEVLRCVKITEKEDDQIIPAFIVKGITKERGEIKLRNTNSPLEKKFNAADLQRELTVGRTYDLDVSHTGALPLDVYGNILNIHGK